MTYGPRIVEKKYFVTGTDANGDVWAVKTDDLAVAEAQMDLMAEDLENVELTEPVDD